MSALPWPDVPECYGPWPAGHPLADHTCPQCDGSHEHRWVEWLAVPHLGVPVRCSVCGARKCDVPECWERRHHRGPHVSVIDGSLTPVGG